MPSFIFILITNDNSQNYYENGYKFKHFSKSIKMENIDIVYSDDEEDIIERIYFLCDVSETKIEKTPDLDISHLLQSRVDTGSTEEVVQVADESFIKNEIIGEKSSNIIKLAIKEGVPQKFIFYDKNDNLVNLKNVLQGMGSTAGLYMVTRDFFKITMVNYMLIYFLANYKHFSDDQLITELNKIENVTNKHFDQITFDEYVREVSIIVSENIKIMKTKLTKIEKFFSEVNSLDFSNQPSEIERTLSMGETSIEIFVRDGEYSFDIDSGGIVFDNLRTTNKIPLIIYISFTKNYYKINEDITNLGDVFNEEYKFEDKSDNHIYLFVKVVDGDVEKIKAVDINLEESKIYFSYPGNTLNQIKDSIKKILPKIVFIEEKKISYVGHFEIDFKGYTDLRMRYLCLKDDIFSNFFYVKENSNPRSLRKNIKYHFKTYEEKTRMTDFKDYSVSFTMDEIYSNRYKVDFRSPDVRKGSLNEFILIFSKLITYYEQLDFSKTLIPVIEDKFSEGLGLGGDYQLSDKMFARTNNKKLDNLIRKAPGMFPRNVYGKFCPCSKQPILVTVKTSRTGKNIDLQKG